MFLYCGNTVLSLVGAEGCTSGEALSKSLSVRNQIRKYLAVCMVNIVHKILVQSSTSPMINSLLNNMLC